MFNLVDVARGIERFAVGGDGRGLLLGGALPDALVDHARHGVAPQFHAGVIEHTGDQLPGELGVGALDQFKRQPPRARIMIFVCEKFLQVPQWQFAFPGGNGVHRRAQPVGSQRVRTVHRRQNFREGRRLGLGQPLPRLRGGCIALPFLAHRANGLDGIGNRSGQQDVTAHKTKRQGQQASGKGFHGRKISQPR